MVVINFVVKAKASGRLDMGGKPHVKADGGALAAQGVPSCKGKGLA